MTTKKHALDMVGDLFNEIEKLKSDTSFSAHDKIALDVVQAAISEAYLQLDKAFDSDANPVLHAEGIKPSVHFQHSKFLHLVSLKKFQLQHIFFQMTQATDEDTLLIYDHGKAVTAVIEKPNGTAIQIYHSESLNK